MASVLDKLKDLTPVQQVVSVAVAGTAAALTVKWLLGGSKGKTVTISVPASTANLACGFDTLGAGFDLNLVLTAQIAPLQKATTFTYEGEGAGEVVLDETNLIWKSALKSQQRYAPGKELPKCKIHVKNPVPFGRGLGSSACAIVAGVTLAGELLRLNLRREDLLNVALEIEDHPDNLSAAIWGGATASGVDDEGNCMIRPFKISNAIKAVVVIPRFQLSTKKAREVLPDKYSRKDCIFNLQRVALLPLALSEDKPDRKLLRELFRDKLHQNQRGPLMPGLAECLAYDGAGLDNKELVAIALSGAGPCIMAVCTGDTTRIGEAIKANLAKHKIESDFKILPFSASGTTVNWS